MNKIVWPAMDPDRRPVRYLPLSSPIRQLTELPIRSYVPNWLFEQAEYSPTPLFRFDGHHLIISDGVRWARYLVHRLGDRHMVSGFMNMDLISNGHPGTISFRPE